MAISDAQLEELAEDKAKILKSFLAAEPPKENGESLLDIWDQLYDDTMKSVIVETTTGPSDDATNRVFPYEKICSIVGDGGNWKWPRMWQRFDELERRGPAFRPGEELNFGQPNKNPNIVPMKVLVVGGGPVGMRLSIELALGGHRVTVFEKRREVRDESGALKQLGFTNRINRPHMWPFVRNDLARLNGKDLMSREACYPVFTEPDTSSIGIDELQILLMKNALMLGVDFRLGVGYNDAKVTTDPKTMRPSWQVDCTYDARAAAKFGRSEGKNVETFDVLMGCDGPRSTVRETQGKLFGNIEKRKFMDCIGIVANVRKVPRSRLKALGFEFGQEPKDMNRTRMVFRDFFQKIEQEADAELENLIYYKASFHNYCILTPKRANLKKHGLSGKVYHFEQGRSQASQDSDEKAKLKDYCRGVLKAAGIPVDETMDNGGFVDAPNDVMAFDFAECWNTPKSIAFNLPPADYDTQLHGEWMGKRLWPMIGLAGDALLEPFWPMGLGLKRGWQAIMDACYVIDNLYNRTLLAEKVGKDPSAMTWDDHYEALQAQAAQNFEFCNRLKVGEELGKGEYSDKSIIVTQLRKLMKDAEKPPLEVEIDPATRYAPLEDEANAKIRAMSKAELENFTHPKVAKALAVADFYSKHSKSGGRGEIDYTAKALISVNGKVRGGQDKGGYKPRISLCNIKPPVLPAAPIAIPKEQVESIALKKRASLTESVMAAKIDDLVHAAHAGGGAGAGQGRRSSRSGAPAGLGALLAAGPPALSRGTSAPGAVENAMLDELAFVCPPEVGDSELDATTAMWDRMHEKNLSPAQQAELEHVRNMITAMEKSLQSYRAAERQLLLGSKK